MTDAVEASINLKEGTIQLIGPQEFVEKYLDQYRQLITSQPTDAKAGKTVESTENEKGKTTTKRKPRTRTGGGCTMKVQELLDGEYFKEPRTRADVQNEIHNRGARFESKEVSATLINCFNGGKLRRTGTGTTAKYYSNT